MLAPLTPRPSTAEGLLSSRSYQPSESYHLPGKQDVRFEGTTGTINSGFKLLGGWLSLGCSRMDWPPWLPDALSALDMLSESQSKSVAASLVEVFPATPRLNGIQHVRRSEATTGKRSKCRSLLSLDVSGTGCITMPPGVLPADSGLLDALKSTSRPWADRGGLSRSWPPLSILWPGSLHDASQKSDRCAPELLCSHTFEHTHTHTQSACAHKDGTLRSSNLSQEFARLR